MTHLSPSFSDEQTQNSEETPSSYNNTEEKIVSERDTGNKARSCFLMKMAERELSQQDVEEQQGEGVKEGGEENGKSKKRKERKR